MRPADVVRVLNEKQITYLYHANSVATSSTFLRLRGLGSRGYLEERTLPQTPQYTDAIDKKYGIWHDVFLDTVDIHERARRRNQYGPVLFVLPATTLGRLPADSAVLVTKKNPTKWVGGEPEGERCFLTAEELSVGLVKGTFDQMIMLRTKHGFVSFPAAAVPIILDDPERKLRTGIDAHASALKALNTAATTSGTEVVVRKRGCAGGCRCVEEYKAFEHFETMFG